MVQWYQMKPVIGITCGEVVNLKEDWAPVVYGQRHTYVDAVVRAGGVPVILPLIADEKGLRELYDICDGLLFAGGNDIGPEGYGEKALPETVDVSPKRDTQEMRLLQWAFADEKPVLGICRGMQALNVARGGSLYQDILTQVKGASNHRESYDKRDFAYVAHVVRLQPDSFLATCMQAENLETNTLHHQAVKDCGEGVVPVAWTEDDVIEAIEVPELPFAVGVQAHPEALEATQPEWRKLFKAFVAASAGVGEAVS